MPARTKLTRSSFLLQVNRQELASTVQDLGGVAARQYSQSVTHFVFAGVKASESFRDFKLAKADGAHIVHPRWIEEVRPLFAASFFLRSTSLSS